MDINETRLEEIQIKLEGLNYKKTADYADYQRSEVRPKDISERFARYVNDEGRQVIIFTRWKGYKLDHYEVFAEVSTSINWSEYLEAIK
jgi:hypothetical protein